MRISVMIALIGFHWGFVGLISQVTVIDAGVGNVQSVSNMSAKIGVPVRLRESPPSTFHPGKDMFLLPGVGAFDRGAESLEKHGWSSFLRDAASSNVAILGLCLGMQLLCESSEEGNHPGLGIIPGSFARISNNDPSGKRRIVPHMGWNEVTFDRGRAKWLPVGTEPQRYYFAHSYRYQHTNDDFVLGHVNYGEPFAAAIKKENTVGLQFHPEKSHRFGQDLLRTIFEKLC